MAPQTVGGMAARERALDAALRLHERGGGVGFTIHNIVRESNVSLGSLYHHFGSMDGLAAALYARCMSELLDALLEPLAKAKTARAGVIALVRAYLTFAQRESACARFIHASAYASFLPAHAAQIGAEKAPRLSRLQSFFRAHVAAGQLVDLPDTMLEMLMIGPVAEVVRRYLSPAPQIDLEQAAALLPERIWCSVKLPASGSDRRGGPRRRGREDRSRPVR
jgi:AcrR family transcriptional regulator